MAEKAGVEDYEIRVIPKPKNIFELMLADLTGGADDDDTIHMATRLGQWRTQSLHQAPKAHPAHSSPPVPTPTVTLGLTV